MPRARPALRNSEQAPLCHQGRVMEAERAQPVGCPQEPGRGLRMDGYVGRS